MRILALEKEVPGASGEDFRPHLRNEAARVWDLYKDGTIREIYFRQDQTTSVIILECEDTAVAREALSTLPLVRQGLIEFEIIPLAAYTGFSRLFAEL
jgi:hypothetical protein